MNIHDTARRFAARLSIPLREAYSRLAKRPRRNYGKTTIQPGAFACVERPANYRLPYADN